MSQIASEILCRAEREEVVAVILEHGGIAELAPRPPSRFVGRHAFGQVLLLERWISRPSWIGREGRSVTSCDGPRQAWCRRGFLGAGFRPALLSRLVGDDPQEVAQLVVDILGALNGLGNSLPQRGAVLSPQAMNSLAEGAVAHT